MASAKPSFTLLQVFIQACLVFILTFQTHAQPGLTRFYQSGKVGYANAKGAIVVAPTYDAGSEFINGFAIVVRHNKMGYINAAGQVAIPLVYDEAAPFYSGLAHVAQQGRIGFIDTLNTWRCADYDAARDFSEGLAAVAVNGKYGFINNKCETIIPQLFDDVRPFTQQLAAAKLQGKWGYIDARGEWKIQPRYAQAGDFNANGIATVVIGKESFEINRAGKIIRELESRSEGEE